MNNYQHLLSKHGILVSFNIAKKIKQSQILAIRRRLEKKNINPKKIEKEIDKEIKSRTQKYLNQTDIPGLVTSDSHGGKIVIDPKIQRKILTLANKVVGVCKLNKFSKILISLIALIAILLMPQTNSIQGYVVAAVGGSTVIFLRLRALKVKLFSWVFLAFVVVSSASSVLGIFQIGPLKTLLYQGTISFRGQYWQAAINMGLAKPLSGVGMDAYGDNYRLFRDAEALISPGVQVITNSAHNVILEQFASGGVLLLTSYIGILALTLASIIRVIRRSTEYDFVFAALVSGWLGYQLQSVISINQLGLAIWGWLLSGLIIAFDYQQVDKTWVTKSLKQSRNNLSSVRDGYVGAKLIGSLGAIVGALIASPPLASDYSWVKSTSTQNINVVVESLQPSYFKPSNVNRMVNAVALMEQNKLFDYSYSWAKKVIEFNPESFDAWRVLYSVKNASITDKAEALRNMKRLDPLNPNVESNP